MFSSPITHGIAREGWLHETPKLASAEGARIAPEQGGANRVLLRPEEGDGREHGAPAESANGCAAGVTSAWPLVAVRERRGVVVGIWTAALIFVRFPQAIGLRFELAQAITGGDQHAIATDGTVHDISGDFVCPLIPIKTGGCVQRTAVGRRIFQKGKPVEKQDILDNIKGLEKLYIGVLRDWYKILIDGGIVVMVLPEIYFSGRAFFVKKVVDTCENLGYTLTQGPYPYSRPQAIVRRQIYVFKKVLGR